MEINNNISDFHHLAITELVVFCMPPRKFLITNFDCWDKASSNAIIRVSN